jgi:hypothetical protein
MTVERYFWYLLCALRILIYPLGLSLVLAYVSYAFLLFSLALPMRLARARPYFFLPAKKVGKNASSSAVLDTYRLDI